MHVAGTLDNAAIFESTSMTSNEFSTPMSNIWARRCYGSKINKDKLIKVTIGLAEPMGGVTRSGVLG
jgi:hypothetical protein